MSKFLLVLYIWDGYMWTIFIFVQMSVGISDALTADILNSPTFGYLCTRLQEKLLHFLHSITFYALEVWINRAFVWNKNKFCTKFNIWKSLEQVLIYIIEFYLFTLDLDHLVRGTSQTDPNPGSHVQLLLFLYSEVIEWLLSTSNKWGID